MFFIFSGTGMPCRFKRCNVVPFLVWILLFLIRFLSIFGTFWTFRMAWKYIIFALSFKKTKKCFNKVLGNFFQSCEIPALSIIPGIPFKWTKLRRIFLKYKTWKGQHFESNFQTEKNLFAMAQEWRNSFPTAYDTLCQFYTEQHFCVKSTLSKEQFYTEPFLHTNLYAQKHLLIFVRTQKHWHGKVFPEMRWHTNVFLVHALFRYLFHTDAVRSETFPATQTANKQFWHRNLFTQTVLPRTLSHTHSFANKQPF